MPFLPVTAVSLCILALLAASFEQLAPYVGNAGALLMCFVVVLVQTWHFLRLRRPERAQQQQLVGAANDPIPAPPQPSASGFASGPTSNHVPAASANVVKVSALEESLWAQVLSQLTAEESALLSNDLKVRNLRGSAFITHQGKRVRYMAHKAKKQAKWIHEAQPSTLLARARSEFPHAAVFRDLALPLTMHGNDPDGNPIAYFALWKSDWKRAGDSTELAGRLLEYLGLHQEALMRAVRVRAGTAKAYGDVQPPYVAIFDLKSLSLGSFKQGYDLGFTSFAQFWGTQYPETLKRVYVVNAPAVLSFVWRLVSPFIEPDTLLKIRILAAHTHEEAFINDGITPDDLPPALGGTHAGYVVVRDDGLYEPEALADRTASTIAGTAAPLLPASTSESTADKASPPPPASARPRRKFPYLTAALRLSLSPARKASAAGT